MYEWTARVRCIPSELEETFSVFIFCGDIPREAKLWEDAPSLVQQCFFMLFGGGGSQVESFAHLSEFMLDKAELSSLDEDVVVPYLKEKLGWRTKQVDDVVVPSERFESLEVMIIRTTYYKEPGQPLPKPGRVKEYPGITFGRPGGSKRKE